MEVTGDRPLVVLAFGFSQSVLLSGLRDMTSFCHTLWSFPLSWNEISLQTVSHNKPSPPKVVFVVNLVTTEKASRLQPSVMR